MKDLIVTPPEGYEVDKENSTFEKIVFKKVKSTKQSNITGFFIGTDSEILYYSNKYRDDKDYNVFATEKQAKAALAMARISQIMANDKRFGGIITDEEWADGSTIKFIIYRVGKSLCLGLWNSYYNFIAFHTKEQRDLFLKENEDLVKDYLMLD